MTVLAENKKDDGAEAADLCAFIDRSPSPFHAVQEMVRRLGAAGFTPLHEAEPWVLAPGDRRYVVRQSSSIIAFVLGKESVVGTGFKMVGAHTDSPCLKVKPNPNVARQGYAMLGCEVYGGALLSTWMDRDLKIAGRITLADGTSRLWDSSLGPTATAAATASRSDKSGSAAPLARLRIPNLAIHFSRDVNREGAKLNAQNHLVPVLGLANKENPFDWREALAGELKVPADQVVHYDLCLAPTEPSALGGWHGEFIFAPRLDNLASCHAAVSALINATEASGPSATALCVCYDHEEVGSVSAQGAHSPFLRETLLRITLATGAATETAAPQDFERALARSFLISADMAHGVHPNYHELSEPEHLPLLGSGPVIKFNAGQRYATNSVSAARFSQWCRAVGVRAQQFVMRNDLSCGSTIGPISAGELGVLTVDVGNPLLSMHSIREQVGSADVSAMLRVLEYFFAN